MSQSKEKRMAQLITAKNTIRKAFLNNKIDWTHMSIPPMTNTGKFFLYFRIPSAKMENLILNFLKERKVNVNLFHYSVKNNTKVRISEKDALRLAQALPEYRPKEGEVFRKGHVKRSRKKAKKQKKGIQRETPQPVVKKTKVKVVTKTSASFEKNGIFVATTIEKFPIDVLLAIGTSRSKELQAFVMEYLKKNPEIAKDMLENFKAADYDIVESSAHRVFTQKLASM